MVDGHRSDRRLPDIHTPILIVQEIVSKWVILRVSFETALCCFSTVGL
jgi:hypothetical protein